MPEIDSFTDILAANAKYAAQFVDEHLQAKAAKRLAVLTCIDSRIDPLAMLGLSRGDAKILRNAGARVTEDVLRTLVLGHYLLGVERVMVIAHTGCRMTVDSDASIHSAIASAGGPDTRSLSFLTSDDVERTLMEDVQRIHSDPYLGGVSAAGFLYHLESGAVEPIC